MIWMFVWYQKIQYNQLKFTVLPLLFLSFKGRWPKKGVQWSPSLEICTFDICKLHLFWYQSPLVPPCSCSGCPSMQLACPALWSVTQVEQKSLTYFLPFHICSWWRRRARHDHNKCVLWRPVASHNPNPSHRCGRVCWFEGRSPFQSCSLHICSALDPCPVDGQGWSGG